MIKHLRIAFSELPGLTTVDCTVSIPIELMRDMAGVSALDSHKEVGELLIKEIVEQYNTKMHRGEIHDNV